MQTSTLVVPILCTVAPWGAAKPRWGCCIILGINQFLPQHICLLEEGMGSDPPLWISCALIPWWCAPINYHPPGPWPWLFSCPAGWRDAPSLGQYYCHCFSYPSPMWSSCWGLPFCICGYGQHVQSCFSGNPDSHGEETAFLGVCSVCVWESHPF